MSVPTLNLNPDTGPAPAFGNPSVLDAFLKQKDAAQLVQWTNEKYKQIKVARSVIERQWYINLAFYYGKQYISLVTTSSNASGNNFRLMVPQAPPWRVRMVANKVRPIIRTELAKVTAQKPNATVYPASNDDRDIFAARAGEQIYDSLYRRKKMKNTLRRAQYWNLICGNGFIKDWWDPNAFDPDASTPGDIMIAPETPFHIMVPDFREEELEDQPYLIHASTKSPDWVNAHYGKALKGRSINPNTAQATDILDSAFLNLVGAAQLMKDSVLCLEVWIKPGGHKLFPGGGMFTLLGDTIVQAVGLEHEPWPFKHNQYPFTKFDHIPTGKFYSDSVITDLIPLQKEYNRCYDSETQILTSEGWKNGTDLKVGESVLTFDPKTKHLKFGPVREMFMKQYDGPVTVLEGAQISARTTPGHKWFVKSSEGHDKIVTKLTSDHSIPLCAPVDIEGSDDYNLHKIVGLVLTDGRMHHSGVFISQSESANPEKCEEIFQLLSDELVPYTAYSLANNMLDFYIPKSHAYKIKQLIPNKRLTAEYISTLGPKGLQGLFDGMMLGDGMYEGDKGAKFYTSLESEADLFQMICILLGKAATVRKQLARSDWAVRPYQYIVQVKTEKFSKARVFRAKKADENYEGTIWCPTVDTGFVMVRRNGKAYISGNTRSQIVEAKNRMAKPQLMAYKGSVNPAQMTTEPGQVILVTPGFQMPTPIRLEPLPTYVLEELQRCQADMDDISGQHEITKGRVPPGVTAATAISYLQEQDDSKISHTIDSIEDGMEKIAQHWLSHVVQFWDVPRIVKVVGNDGAYDAQALKGSDLRGNTDIKVEAGSALPTSKAAKQAYVMDLMKMGFIPPEEGLKVLEFGGVEKLYGEMQIDVRQAQRENLRMQEPDPQSAMLAMQAEQAGQPPQPMVPVNDWDNHAVHVTTHNKFRKSAAFEQLDDAVKQEFQAHVAQHQMILQQQMMQQMQMGQPQQPGAAPGGPPPPGGDQGEAPPEGQM